MTEAATLRDSIRSSMGNLARDRQGATVLGRWERFKLERFAERFLDEADIRVDTKALLRRISDRAEQRLNQWIPQLVSPPSPDLKVREYRNALRDCLRYHYEKYGYPKPTLFEKVFVAFPLGLLSSGLAAIMSFIAPLFFFTLLDSGIFFILYAILAPAVFFLLAKALRQEWTLVGLGKYQIRARTAGFTAAAYDAACVEHADEWQMEFIATALPEKLDETVSGAAQQIAKLKAQLKKIAVLKREVPRYNAIDEDEQAVHLQRLETMERGYREQLERLEGFESEVKRLNTRFSEVSGQLTSALNSRRALESRITEEERRALTSSPDVVESDAHLTLLIDQMNSVLKGYPQVALPDDLPEPEAEVTPSEGE